MTENRKKKHKRKIQNERKQEDYTLILVIGLGAGDSVRGEMSEYRNLRAGIGNISENILPALRELMEREDLNKILLGEYILCTKEVYDMLGQDEREAVAEVVAQIEHDRVKEKEKREKLEGNYSEGVGFECSEFCLLLWQSQRAKRKARGGQCLRNMVCQKFCWRRSEEKESE